MNGEINLDQTPDDTSTPALAGAGGVSPADTGPNYPSLMVDNAPPALANFPDKGHALVKFSVHHRSTQKGPRGKIRHTVGLHIHSIKPHKGFAKKSMPLTDKGDGDAVDNYFGG